MNKILPLRVGYVVKRYPRYSETFIVNEILAHERAGLSLDIFALRGPEDTHFQDSISRVRAAVTYLPDHLSKSSEFWSCLQQAGRICPGVWSELPSFRDQPYREIAHAAALAAQCVRREITHLHAHFATSATTTARMAARMAGISYSFTAHAKDIFHESVEADDLRQKCRDARDIVTVSEFNLEYLRGQFPDSTARLHRIYNGLDLQHFRFADAFDRPPLIITVGRLVEKKGIRYLLDACAQLRAKGLVFRCEIVGTGECETALRQQLGALELEDTVTLVGALPQREVISRVQAAAVFAAPCVIGEDGNRDGLPTVLLEAMALGTPCVGTDVTGIPEALLDGKTGYCIAQRDVPALAERLEQLLFDGQQRQSLALAARRHIETLFNGDGNAAQLRQLFQADVATGLSR